MWSFHHQHLCSPFILFRRNINYLLPRLLNIWKSDILPRIINCYDVHAYMPQHPYSASYVYIITVYISLYNILKDKISNLTTYTCVTASTDLSAFSLFIRQNFITINLQPAIIHPSKCSSLLIGYINVVKGSKHNIDCASTHPYNQSLNFTAYLKETDSQSNII